MILISDTFFLKPNSLSAAWVTELVGRRSDLGIWRSHVRILTAELTSSLHPHPYPHPQTSSHTYRNSYNHFFLKYMIRMIQNDQQIFIISHWEIVAQVERFLGWDLAEWSERYREVRALASRRSQVRIPAVAVNKLSVLICCWLREVSAHWVCLSAVVHTLLSAPRAARKGWVGAIQIPKFIFFLFCGRVEPDTYRPVLFLHN
jgi:hypothetical protein